jgi:hypothetical protein
MFLRIYRGISDLILVLCMTYRHTDSCLVIFACKKFNVFASRLNILHSF